MRLNYIDCCDNVQGLKTLPDDSIDLTVTSPPYDNLRSYNGFTWEAESLIRELFRVTKPGGVVVWIVADATIKGSETGTSFRQALAFKDAGFNLHDTMIWRKPHSGGIGSLKRYEDVFEYMFVLSKGTPEHVNIIKDKPNKRYGEMQQGSSRQKDGSTRKTTGYGKRRVAEFGRRHNVWDVVPCKSPKERLHPAPFPTRLVADHILSWSNPGDIVMDPFMGSGTTAVACLSTGRNYIGFELSEEYCEIARKRIDDARKEEEECASKTRQTPRPSSGQQSQDEVMEEQTAFVV